MSENLETPFEEVPKPKTPFKLPDMPFLVPSEKMKKDVDNEIERRIYDEGHPEERNSRAD